MSHNFVSGDVVRIGKGKVNYTVAEVQSAPEGSVTVQSNNTGKFQDVEASRLTMIEATNHIVQHASEESLEAALNAGEEASSPVIDLTTHNTVAETLAEKGVFLLIDAEEPQEYKSFDAAAFALSRNHTYRVATIVKDRGVTVQRKRVMQ